MDYKVFFENLTGYRITEIYIFLGKTGLIDLVNSSEEGMGEEEICCFYNWDKSFGSRFLKVLTHLNILEFKDNCYFLTEYSCKYFLKTSGMNQNASLNFERDLTDSFRTLESVLKSGKREFNSDYKDEESYRKSLSVYINAMDDAAKIRAVELWDSFIPENEGTILDLGAGSGAFLCEFLERHRGWRGIFCDLDDVIDLSDRNKRLQSIKERIDFYPCNILENSFADLKIKPDMVLLSNIVHCYTDDEILKVFRNIAPLASEKTRIIIHDFFKDLSVHGAMYDLHMMLNTFSGKAYATSEIFDLMDKSGFESVKVEELASHSAFIVFKKK